MYTKLAMRTSIIKTTNEKSGRWSTKQRSYYESYGDNGSIFACTIDFFINQYISVVKAYSSETGKLYVMGYFDDKLIIADCSVSSAADIEGVVAGKYRSIVLQSEDTQNALLIGSILSDITSEESCYYVSLGGSLMPSFLDGEYVIKDSRKGYSLVDYLSLFEVRAGVAVAGGDAGILKQLLLCREIKSAVVIPSDIELDGLPDDIAALRINDLRIEIALRSNDTFKRSFIRIAEESHADLDNRIYAYLLNDIDRTDTLDTIRTICERKVGYNASSLDEEYGTSILYNAVNCSDGCHTGCISDGGAAYVPSIGEGLDIIRYLVTKGFRYSGHNGFAGMANDRYDSFKLSSVFRTMMEAGYEAINDDLYRFVRDFISMAQSNDHLTPIDDSHGPTYFQRLDKIRCEQFREMSPYIPDDVFLIRDADGDTLLIWAAQRLDELPGLFKLILERTPNIDAINEEGKTALHYVSDLECWDALIAAGADADIKDNDGEIPSLGFDKDKLEKLLRKDEFSDSDRSFAERMLFSILENCYSADRTYEAMDMISALLGIIRPAARDNGSGNTPLMSIIIQEGFFPELYDQILSIGVDINAVDRNGETALQLVILSPECTAAKIRYLIDHGADPSGKSYRGSIASMAAGLFHIGSVEWNAMWAAADKSIFIYRTDKAMSPLMIALRYQNMEAIRFLFTHDAVLEDELDMIAEAIRKIKAATVRNEAYSYLESYKERHFNGNKE